MEEGGVQGGILKEGKIFFVTSNQHKFSEAERILKAKGINIAHHPERVEEVRAEDCATVAREAAVCAYEKLKKPLFVEDSGLFIDALNGFPGVYSAFAFKRIGNEGLLKLMKGKEEKERSAKFVSCVAFAGEGKVKVFSGECLGSIAEEMKGKEGFGFDPVFIPERSGKTFAQDVELKEKVSHRKMALMKFAKWLKKESRGEK